MGLNKTDDSKEGILLKNPNACFVLEIEGIHKVALVAFEKMS